MIKSKQLNLRLGPFFLSVVCISVSCSQQTPIRKESDYSQGSIYKSEKEAPIPRSLVQLLEKNYISVYRETNPGSTLTDLEVSLKVPRRLMQLTVFLREKNLDTLTANSRFQLPHGGGSIDFANLVNKGKGLFYLDFDFADLSPEQSENLRVFFISNAKTFEFSGQRFGAGCGKFFEITHFFQRQRNSRGIELAAADLRYLGQILGTFVFAYTEPSALHIASVTFLDNRYPDSHCTLPGQ